MTDTAASSRDRIVSAFMELLADKPFQEIGMSDVAARTGITLGALRNEFGSPLAILAAHVKNIDRAVLDGGDGDMSDEPPRERLFDVLMRRIEMMEPYKAATRSLLRSARRDPGLALALNAMAVRSQSWMLTAADIPSTGRRGMIRAQGLAVLFARVIATFVKDDDPGHARTMAKLDRELGRAHHLARVFDDLCRFLPRCPPRRRRRDEDSGDTQVVA